MNFPAGPASSSADTTGSPVAVMVVFAMAGLVISQTLARMPAVRDAVGASTGELGVALVGAGLGALIAMPFTGRLVDQFGSRAVVRVCMVLAAVGWSSVAFVSSPVLLGIVLVLAGAPFGLWDVAMNVQGSHIEKARRRSLMPYFHAAFSGGAVLGAGAGALAAYFGIGLIQLPILGAFAILAGLVAVRSFVGEEPDQSHDLGPHGGLGADVASRRGVTRMEILIGVVCLGGALAEGSAGDWLALLLVDVQGAPAALGALALTAFNIAMAVGRVAGGPLIDRFGRDWVTRAGGGLAIVGILLASQVPSLPGALLGGLIWGLGTSTIFPAAISAAGEVPGRGNRAITVVSTIAYGAFLFGAPMIGLLAEVFGLDRALFVVIGFVIATIALAGTLRSQAVARAPQRATSIQ